MYVIIELDKNGIQVCRQDLDEDDLAAAVGTAIEMTDRSPHAVILRQKVDAVGSRMATFHVEFVQMIQAKKGGK